MAETTPYVKQTWTDGSSSASAARFTFIEEGVRAAHEQPAVSVTHSAAQGIVTSTHTVLGFDTENFDTAFGSASTQHDTATNPGRLIARYAGKYMISGGVEWQANGTGYRILRIRLNGTTIIKSVNQGFTVAGDTTLQTIDRLYTLAVNDYVELMVWQNSGAGLNVNTAASYSPVFEMVRVA